MGNEIITNATDKFEYKFTVIEDVEKGMVIEVEYDSVYHLSDDLQYIEPDFSQLIGEKAEFHLSSLGRLSDFEDFDDLPVLRSPTLGTINEEKYLIHLRIQFPILPEKHVKLGDKWIAERYFEEHDQNALFKVNINYNYTLVEETRLEGTLCLKIKSEYIFDIKGKGEMQGMPFDGNLSGTGEETIYFDYVNGFLLQVDGMSKIKGEMEFKEDEFSIPMHQEFKEGVKVTIIK